MARRTDYVYKTLNSTRVKGWTVDQTTQQPIDRLYTLPGVLKETQAKNKIKKVYDDDVIITEMTVVETTYRMPKDQFMQLAEVVADNQ